jgi:hypothetical protein
MHEYEGEYTYEDYLLANRLNYSSMRTTKITRVVLVLLLLVSVALAIVSPIRVLFWFFIVFLVALLGFPYTLMPWMTRRVFERQEQFHGHVKIIFDSDKITSIGADGEATITGLDHYIVSDKMILLYLAPTIFIMLPRRFMGSDAEVEYVQNYLKEFPTDNP